MPILYCDLTRICRRLLQYLHKIANILHACKCCIQHPLLHFRSYRVFSFTAVIDSWLTARLLRCSYITLIMALSLLPHQNHIYHAHQLICKYIANKVYKPLNLLYQYCQKVVSDHLEILASIGRPQQNFESRYVAERFSLNLFTCLARYVNHEQQKIMLRNVKEGMDIKNMPLLRYE